MVKIGKKQMFMNAESWKSSIDSTADYYQAALAGKTLEQSKEQFACFRDCAHAYVDCAFTFLVGELYDLADDVLGHAIRVAEEALRVEDFVMPRKIRPQEVPGSPEPIEYDDTYKPTPEEIHEARRGYIMSCVWDMHYAVWFKTGQRPLDMWKRYVDMRVEMYKPVSNRYCDDPVAKAEIEHEESPELLIMLELAELGDYDEVIRIYKNYRYALRKPPKDARFNHCAEHVLYVLSEYAIGNDSLKPLACGGIDYWYAKSLNWTDMMIWSSWWTRIGWAYLRGKHFTGVIDARKLIRDLRGY